MPCFRAVCNRKCASCGNICALRGAAMRGMLTADREIPPPPERMFWPRRKSGSFFMAGKTGHKKRPDLIRGGPSPLELPRGSVSLPTAAAFEPPKPSHSHTVQPDIKKAGSHSRQASPLELPHGSVSLPTAVAFEPPKPSHSHTVQPDIKKTGSHSRRAFPPRAPPRLCLFTLGRSRSINSKRAPCRSRVLLLFWLFCILCFAVRALQPEQIRHSRLSWSWPALRVPCCPRRRGQWQG